MTFQSMLAPVAEDLRRVDELIAARLESDVALVRKVAEYLVGAGGKRLRPALVLLACGALGYLFEAAARLGAVLARSAPEVEEGLARYGAHVGTAFQLIDDVLDYSGDEAAIGKQLGDDLAEGKPTLPLIHALRSGNAAEQAVVRQAIVAGGRARFRAGVAAHPRRRPPRDPRQGGAPG